MLIVGEQEMKTRTVSVRLRSGTEIKGVSLDHFVQELNKEVKTRNLEPLFKGEQTGIENKPHVKPAPGGVPSQKS